jgi:hypothetical protein
MIQNRKPPGRNDPCWCGSGKKYKHCHQRADEERASEKLQKDALWHALGEFALQRKYELDFKTAAKFFFDADESPDPEGDADEQADFERALDYFLFDYRLPDNTRVIEHFAKEQSRMLSPRQRAWLTDWLNGAPALLEIISVERGVGIRARDLLTGEIYEIHDKLGSETTTRWNIAFTRVLRTDAHYELGGSGLNVPPRFRDMLRAYVENLRAEYERRYPDDTRSRPSTSSVERDRVSDATTQEFLRAHAHLINQFILDEIGSAMQQLPLMFTPERDLMEHAIATYAVLNPADALARLRAAPEFQELEAGALDTRDFAWNETGESLAQLRSHGAPFEWQTPAGDPNGVRALGTLKLALDELTLDVMSRRRLRAGKALLEKHLGETIQWRDETIESFAEALRGLDKDADEFDDDAFEDEDEFDDEWEFTGDAEGDDADESDADVTSFEPKLPDLTAPPNELQEMLARYRANLNQAWIDQKVPALDNQTPRQAVQSFGGRLQVIRLLKDFEAREADNARRGVTTFDWGAVARELGLSDQEFVDETRVEELLNEMLSLTMELTVLHQTDQAWAGWQKFRELCPIQRADELSFAQVWALEETLTETVMELEHLLARQKRFDDARTLLDDYIALDADALDWALAERQAVEIERAIFDEPAAVQAAVAELERLAQDKDNAFQALIVLAELQEGLLHMPDAAVQTLLRAEQAALDDSAEQRVYDTLLEHFDSFQKCDAGKTYWHQCNDGLLTEECDNAGLVRLLLACNELDEASAVVADIAREETRAYFAGMIAARRGDLDAAREIWQIKLSETLEHFNWRWFEWAEMSLYLRDSAAVLEKIDPAAHANHFLAHWHRAFAYAQQNDFENASRAAKDARAAMREQSRRMDYDSSLRHRRALADALGLPDAAARALNFDFH